MAEYDLICCVANIGDASKIFKIGKEYDIKGGTISIGHGTVHNRILEFLKLNDIRKEFISLVVKRELAEAAMKAIRTGMQLEKPNHGIIFSHSLLEVTVCKKSGDKKEIIKVEEKKGKKSEVKDAMYKAIYVVVEKGVAEDVVEVATKAGARGATILNARGAGTQEAQTFFSLEIEPEKEKVFIITKDEQKDAIVEAINNYLEVEGAGNGITYVLDVNEAYGLH